MRIVLPVVTLLVTASVAMGGPLPPSFDCSKATTSAEKLVCSDSDLTKLDLKLADLYVAAQKKPDQAAEQKASQRKWLISRNGCSKSPNLKSCVQSAYEWRIAEIQIQTGLLRAPEAIGYNCAGADTSKPFTASFYNETDPQSVVVTYGNDQVVATLQQSGSGAKYGAPGFEFWEHHGESMVAWHGKKFTCKERK